MKYKILLIGIILFIMSSSYAYAGCYEAKLIDLYNLDDDLAGRLGITDTTKVCYTGTEAISGYELSSNGDNKICEGAIDQTKYDARATLSDIGVDIIKGTLSANSDPLLQELIDGWDNFIAKRVEILNQLQIIIDDSQSTNDEKNFAQDLYNAIDEFNPMSCSGTAGSDPLPNLQAYFWRPGLAPNYDINFVPTFLDTNGKWVVSNNPSNIHRYTKIQYYISNVRGDCFNRDPTDPDTRDPTGWKFTDTNIPVQLTYGECIPTTQTGGLNSFSYGGLQTILTSILNAADSTDAENIIADKKDFLTVSFDAFHACVRNIDGDGVSLVNMEQVREWNAKANSDFGNDNPFQPILINNADTFLDWIYASEKFSLKIKPGVDLVSPNDQTTTDSIKFNVYTDFECVDFDAQKKQTCCIAHRGGTKITDSSTVDRRVGYTVDTPTNLFAKDYQVLASIYIENNFVNLWTKDLEEGTSNNPDAYCRVDNYISKDGQRCTPSLTPGDTLYDYLDTDLKLSIFKFIANSFVELPMEEIDSALDGGGSCNPSITPTRSCSATAAYLLYFSSLGSPMQLKDSNNPQSVCRMGIQTCGADNVWGACTGVGLPNMINFFGDKLGESYDISGSSFKKIYFISPTMDVEDVLGAFNLQEGSMELTNPNNVVFSNTFQGEGFDDDCDGIIDDGVADFTKVACELNKSQWDFAWPLHPYTNTNQIVGCCGDDGTADTFLGKSACIQGKMSTITNPPHTHRFSDEGEERFLLDKEGGIFLIFPYNSRLYSCGDYPQDYMSMPAAKDESYSNQQDQLIPDNRKIGFCGEDIYNFTCTPTLGWMRNTEIYIGDSYPTQSPVLKQPPEGMNLINGFNNPIGAIFMSDPQFLDEGDYTFLLNESCVDVGSIFIIANESQDNILEEGSADIINFHINENGTYFVRLYDVPAGCDPLVVNQSKLYIGNNYVPISIEVDNTVGNNNPAGFGCCPSDYCWNPNTNHCVPAIVSSENSVSECNDGIDNDEDGYGDFSTDCEEGANKVVGGTIDCTAIIENTNIIKGDSGCASENDWTESEDSSLLLSQGPIEAGSDNEAVLNIKGDENKIYSCVMQNANPNDPSTFNAQWVLTESKLDWNKANHGFCPGDTCYYTNNGEDTCVANHYIEDDHICVDGNWTTRTSFIVKKMLDYAGSSSFTLYCGGFIPQDFLDYYENSNTGDHYSVNDAGDMSSLMKLSIPSPAGDGADSFNNFCVLLKDNEVLIGSSSNLGKDTSTTKYHKDEFDRSYEGFLNIFYQLSRTAEFADYIPLDDEETYTYCDSAINRNPVDFPGEYSNCGPADNPDGRLWYNKELNTFIFSKEEVTLSSNGIFAFFQDLFEKINIFSESNYVSEIEKVSDYNKIYLNNKQDASGGKAIVGFSEDMDNKNIVIVNYEGFDSEEICRTVNDYLVGKLMEYEGITDYRPEVSYCTVKDGVAIVELPKYYMPSNPQDTIIVIVEKDIFPDLTSKIRVQ